MRKKDKINLVADLNEDFSGNSIAVVFYYHGLTVSDMTNLRKKVRASSAVLKIAKNRLVKIAIKDTDFECLGPILTGPSAIAYSNEPGFVKVISEFAKEKASLKIVGGAINGELLDKKSVELLATLPSLDELRGKIVGILQSPASRVVGVVQGAASKIARVLNLYATKQ